MLDPKMTATLIGRGRINSAVASSKKRSIARRPKTSMSESEAGRTYPAEYWMIRPSV